MPGMDRMEWCDRCRTMERIVHEEYVPSLSEIEAERKKHKIS
jgi:hypothetical protein